MLSDLVFLKCKSLTSAFALTAKFLALALVLRLKSLALVLEARSLALALALEARSLALALVSSGLDYKSGAHTLFCLLLLPESKCYS